MFCTTHIKERRLCLCTALFFICNVFLAQQPYFQQEVNYTIDVKLNDAKNTLSAFEKIQYINNSPEPLSFIYFHLWPNAYRNNNTALAKQFLKQGRTTLFFSKEEERGFIDSLDFKINGKAIKWEYDKNNIDICQLILNEPLKPGDSISITTPFFVKIPGAEFSRLGHTGQAYFITQWYPKPAVFDNTGWHPMPYLDQGEFYSEFGSFDVSITLPKNYVLAATGDRLPNEEDALLLSEKESETARHFQNNDFDVADMAFPASATAYKTVRFKQRKVHDFAWFADKRFNVMRGSVQMPLSKRTVNTWVFFTNRNSALWKDALSYVNESTLFYSELNGEYPYGHVTAVDGTIMAGGGMEYPNITVIGNPGSAFELDVTITHEVGHNWFYGMLGSNERDFPFMDEGLNSLYEMRYIRAKYSRKKITEFIGRDSTFKLLRLNKVPVWKTNDIAFLSALNAGTDQQISLPAPGFTSANYGSIVYSKSALVFDYLMEYLGPDNFDKAMRTYFEKYKFKHPAPAGLLKTLSASTGVNLNGFEKYLLASTARVDYKIKSVKHTGDSTYTLRIKNKTGTPLPFNIYAYKNGEPVSVTWLDGFAKSGTANFKATGVDYFKIDGLDRLPDINRKNNGIKTHGLFKKAEPLQLNFITAMEDPEKTQVNYLPLLGANIYNGFMLGAAVHNYSFYQKKFEYAIAPMYAFNTRTPAGFAELNFNMHPKKVFRQIVLGAKLKTFAYDFFNTKYINENYGTGFKDLYYNYYKIAPYIQFEIKKKDPTSPVKQTITYTNNNLFTDSLDQSAIVSLTTSGPRKKNTYSFVNQLSYGMVNSRAVDPFSFGFNLQHTATMAKAAVTYNQKLMLSEKYYFEIRVFAGAFLAGNEDEKYYYALRAAGYNGYQDYLFDGNFAGRNETSGFGFSQFLEQEGALKVWTPLGQTTQWLASVNIKSPRLYKLPVKAFADFAVCDGRALLTDKFLWDAGINITIVKDIVDVYIPLVYNNDIKNILTLNDIAFLNRIRFTFNIHKLVPRNLLQSSFF